MIAANKQKINNNTNNNNNNNNNNDNSNNNKLLSDPDVYVCDELIKQIEAITDLKDSYEYIQQFLLKIYKTIDEAEEDEQDQLLNDDDDGH